MGGISAPYEVAISPEGRSIVWGVDTDGGVGLYVRPIDQLNATPLRGGEGGWSSFFSPDGDQVGFYHRGEGTISRVSVSGGPAVKSFQRRDAAPSEPPDDPGNLTVNFHGGLLTPHTAW